MKKTKFLITTAILGIATFVAIAADHIDAPAVDGGGTSSLSDITDYYAFQGSDPSNIAFVANVQGFLSPASTGSATFDENVMIEFNIDTNLDAVEDLVIQAIPQNGKMYFFGPYPAGSTTLSSTIDVNSANQGVVDISQYGQPIVVENSGGIQYFAGPRDDPFYFDFGRFTQILTPGDDDGDGMEETAFLPVGNDSFASTNVLSVVVEVPKSMIGGSGSVHTWVETKRRQ